MFIKYNDVFRANGMCIVMFWLEDNWLNSASDALIFLFSKFRDC